MLSRATLRGRPWLSRSAIYYRAYGASPRLIDIKDATFYRQYPSENDASSNPPLFPNLNFEVNVRGNTSKQKDHWAVVGPPDRLEFLNVLRGQHISVPLSARSYPYLSSDAISQKTPNFRLVENAIQYVGFAGEGSHAIGGTRGAYLSARYESLREETDWTVEQYLRNQTSLNPMEGEENGTVYDEAYFDKICCEFHVRELLGEPVASLSNGQTRRVRVAKALIQKPELLILDEPFLGLDPSTVKGWSRRLHRMASHFSPRMILSFRDQQSLPDWINHLVLVGHNCQIIHQGPRDEVEKMLEEWAIYQLTRPKTAEAKKLSPVQRTTVEKQLRALKSSGALDDDLALELSDPHIKKRPVFQELPAGGDPLIEMTGVHVQYGTKVVLGGWNQQVHNETQAGLHWRVRRGQRWALLGANGSGKTTLLSLITSDHPQAYAQPVKVFGRSRLPEAGKPGISIFELQSRIGHSSPEIHAFFPRQLTIRQAVESAFAETFLSTPYLTTERDRDVTAILGFFKHELDRTKATSKVALNPELNPELFPTLPVLKPNRGKYEEAMETTQRAEYADDVLFSDLTMAQQRIVLFIRALVHRPDIVILDEALSGLDYHSRNKCLKFLEHGSKMDGLPGLSEDQALIMVTHCKEEIPDSVRYFMRLPFKKWQTSKRIPFRQGVLLNRAVLRQEKLWEGAWTLDTKARIPAEQEKTPDMIEFHYVALYERLTPKS